MMAGTLKELVLACALYGALPMRFELNLRLSTTRTLAALIDLSVLHQCEHAWLKLRVQVPVGRSSQLAEPDVV